MTAQEVILRPNPGPQTLALSCPCDEIFYGGARGGGKGVWLILDWLRHASLCGGKARGLLVRKYLTDLVDFIAETKKYLPRLGWTFREQAKEWHGPDGSLLSLRYLEREEDAEGYQGWNLSWLAVDEAGQYQTSLAIDLLRATLRLPGVPERVLRLTGNPGGPGHQWLKSRYVTPARPMTPIREKLQLPEGSEVETVRVFIPARLKDNPACNTPEYQKNLLLSAGGRAWLVKAWLEGDWCVVVSGGVFDLDKVNFGELPPLDFPVTGWDTAFTEDTRNDESAAAHIGLDAAKRYWLANLWHGRLDLGKLPDKVIVLRRAWMPRWAAAEGGPAGQALLPLVKERMRGDAPFPFELVSHMHDKIAKNAAFASVVNSGRLWVPKGAAWWPYLRDQMLIFDGEDGKLDDCIDACGVACRELDRLMPSMAAAAPPPALPDRARQAFLEARIAEVRQKRQAGSEPRTMFRR